jgi:phosphoribosyl-ATP pyrophosphohydrolase/phosphoribosyl-AMP cyclohydrolase/histidinol dehydrogenase
MVVGPGNRWVTAAKHIVSADVGIDMLAGPSELLVIADDSADPDKIAADLLAQAEHDGDAIPMLIVLDEAVIGRVESALRKQLADLPARATATAALRNGFVIRAACLDEVIEVADRIAPEHLQLSNRAAEQVAPRFGHYGAIFIGEASAEVLGDYGAGPNHVLPTGGTARFRAGLSVMTFLRFQTQLTIDDAAGAGEIIEDSIALARLEGLEAHARSAEKRRQ